MNALNSLKMAELIEVINEMAKIMRVNSSNANAYIRYARKWTKENMIIKPVPHRHYHQR